MPTYNGEQFLPEQLRSLADQALLLKKLAICDDMSSDATVDIIETFAKTTPFSVRLLPERDPAAVVGEFHESDRIVPRTVHRLLRSG